VTERVTLITGASAGIGAELARVFAAHGHRVALVARRVDRLATLAAEIKSAGAAAPLVIPCDLEQPDAAEKIAATLVAEGMEVEYLVNNAGFGVFGQAIRRDRAEQLGIIAVNIRALTDLTLRFADDLIKNGGGILNVSAANVAKCGYRGLMANKRAVLPGLGIKIVPLLLRMFPRAFILAAVARFQLRKR